MSTSKHITSLPRRQGPPRALPRLSKPRRSLSVSVLPFESDLDPKPATQQRTPEELAQELIDRASRTLESALSLAESPAPSLPPFESRVASPPSTSGPSWKDRYEAKVRGKGITGGPPAAPPTPPGADFIGQQGTPLPAAFGGGSAPANFQEPPAGFPSVGGASSGGSSVPSLDSFSTGPDWSSSGRGSPSLPSRDDLAQARRSPTGSAPRPASPPGGGVSTAVLTRPTQGLELQFESEGPAVRMPSGLPVFQSVYDLTKAVLPPTMGTAMAPSLEAAPVEEAEAGAEKKEGFLEFLADEAGVEASTQSLFETFMRLEGDSGTLADGSTWEKEQGEELGANGYWKRWFILRGTATVQDEQGNPVTVAWEETTWEASDYSGYRQMGARKTGSKTFVETELQQETEFAKWEEFWEETISRDATTGSRKVERRAEKWATDDVKAEGWSEKWGENYWSDGRTERYADKWSQRRADGHTWQEKWGENWDGHGGAGKWTDKWAEQKDANGHATRWGDKWEQGFREGQGYRRGEVWTGATDSHGPTYQRWWAEDHLGESKVRKHGHSTSGEYWDVVEHEDTWYEKAPHNGGFWGAIRHSPQLKSVAELPRDALVPIEEGGVEDL